MNRKAAEEVAREAEGILSSIAPGAVCIAQDWDSRVDCLITLGNGSVIGEMIRLSDLTETRLRETGERLRLRSEGRQIQLVDEIQAPIRIGPKGD